MFTPYISYRGWSRIDGMVELRVPVQSTLSIDRTTFQDTWEISPVLHCGRLLSCIGTDCANHLVRLPFLFCESRPYLFELDHAKNHSSDNLNRIDYIPLISTVESLEFDCIFLPAQVSASFLLPRPPMSTQGKHHL